MDHNALVHLIRNFCAGCAARIKQLEKGLAMALYPTDKEFFLDYAWRFLGTPYKWGGDDPMSGFDCSGFVVESMKAIDLLPYQGDWTAHALWILFKHLPVNWPEPGDLVFWQSRSSQVMVHVEICVHRGISLGAGGGGSNIITLQDAIDHNAYIRARPFKNRDGRKLFYVDPFKEG